MVTVKVRSALTIDKQGLSHREKTLHMSFIQHDMMNPVDFLLSKSKRGRIILKRRTLE